MRSSAVSRAGKFVQPPASRSLGLYARREHLRGSTDWVAYHPFGRVRMATKHGRDKFPQPSRSRVGPWHYATMKARKVKWLRSIPGKRRP